MKEKTRSTTCPTPFPRKSMLIIPNKAKSRTIYHSPFPFCLLSFRFCLDSSFSQWRNPVRSGPGWMRGRASIRYNRNNFRLVIHGSAFACPHWKTYDEHSWSLQRDEKGHDVFSHGRGEILWWSLHDGTSQPGPSPLKILFATLFVIVCVMPGFPCLLFHIKLMSYACWCSRRKSVRCWMITPSRRLPRRQASWRKPKAWSISWRYVSSVRIRAGTVRAVET